MDHLPVPDNCKGRALEVPYLGLAKYDGQDFDGFLERQGLTECQLLELLEGERTRLRGESLLQEWLYFGCLHTFSSICGLPEVHLDMESFIKEDDPGGEKTVMSENLRDYLHDVLFEKRKRLEFELLTQHGHAFYPLDPPEAQKWVSHASMPDELLPRAKRLGMKFLGDENQLLMKSCFAQAVGFLNKFASRLGTALFEKLNPPILISIWILHESLAQSCRHMFALNTYGVFEGPFKPLAAAYLSKKMQGNGWCPSRTAKLESGLSLLYFASVLPSFDNRNHGKCFDYKCSATAQSVSELTPQHVGSCPSDCKPISVPVAELNRILENNSYPLLRRLDSASGLEFEIVDAKDQKEYVAISHVWSHGLGNPKSNDLPSCQIRRIFQSVQYLLPTSPQPCLWLDTLCIPAPSTSPSRKPAVSKLRDVYSRAAKVLVLDKCLAEVPLANKIEQRVHLLASEWMSRLWTLQEGVLAKDLFFRYKGAMVSLKLLLGSDLEQISISNVLDQTTCMDLTSALLPDSKIRAKTADDRIRHLLPNITSRSTTLAPDEPVCIATLLNIDLSSFSGMPTMSDVYTSLPSVPRELAFMQAPRLPSKSLRWAPSTLLQQPLQEFMSTTSAGTGTITSQGLVIKAHSIRLKALVSLATGKTYRVYVEVGGKEHAVQVRIGKCGAVVEVIRESTILLRDGDAIDGGRGILVSGIERGKGGKVQCSYQGGVVLNVRDNYPGMDSITGEYSDEQEWCVD